MYVSHVGLFYLQSSVALLLIVTLCEHVCPDAATHSALDLNLFVFSALSPLWGYIHGILTISSIPTKRN